MPQATEADLRRLRRWRTWLLITAAALQGVQYLLAPDRALATPAYTLLLPLGTSGWRVLGAALAVTAALLLTHRARPEAYLALAAIETFLAAAQTFHGYLPSTLILPVGLCLGEVGQLGRARRRRREEASTCG